MALSAGTHKEGKKMKSLTMNLILATAAWMVASSAATAADLKFEIPFTFEAAGKAMAPGTYRLHASNGEVQFQLQNTQTGQAVYFNAPGGYDPEKQWKTREGGVLQFECSGGECGLKQLWTNRGYPAYKFPTPKAGENTRLAIVRSAVR
jgi:hypothetical protein